MAVEIINQPYTVEVAESGTVVVAPTGYNVSVEDTFNTVELSAGGYAIEIATPGNLTVTGVQTVSTVSVSAVGPQGAQGPSGGLELRDITYTYSGDDLTRIDYDDGAYFTFTYNGSGDLSTRTDGTNTWTYGYSGDDLISVTVT